MWSRNSIAGLGSALILAMSAAGAAAEVRPMGPLGVAAPSKPMVMPVAQRGHGGGGHIGGGHIGGGQMGGVRMHGPAIGHINRGPRPGGMINRNFTGHRPAPFVRHGNTNWNNYARFNNGHPRHHRRHGYPYAYGFGYGFPVYSYGYYADDADDECFWSRRRGRWVCPDEE